MTLGSTVLVLAGGCAVFAGIALQSSIASGDNETMAGHDLIDDPTAVDIALHVLAVGAGAPPGTSDFTQLRFSIDGQVLTYDEAHHALTRTETPVWIEAAEDAGTVHLGLKSSSNPTLPDWFSDLSESLDTDARTDATIALVCGHHVLEASLATVETWLLHYRHAYAFNWEDPDAGSRARGIALVMEIGSTVGTKVDGFLFSGFPH